MAESEDREREVQKIERELERQAGQMGKRSEELDSDISSVREEFRRKRNDPETPGLPPEPDADDEERNASPEAAMGHSPGSADPLESAENSDSDSDDDRDSDSDDDRDSDRDRH